MFWFLIVISCTLASAEYSYFAKPQSAASEAQIKFAIENKYDDTGPGAKERETAYNTYKNLDEALLSYLNDPDTKLPEFEKAVAVNKLLKSNKYYTKAAYPFLPKYGLEFAQKPYLDDLSKKGYWNFKESIFNDKFKAAQRIPLVERPETLGFFPTGSSPKPVSPSPLYSLEYDVDRQSKPGPGQGAFIRGYYSLKDGEGRTKIIEYSGSHDGYTASERSDVTK